MSPRSGLPSAAPRSSAPDTFVERGPFDVVLELIGAPNIPSDLDALAVGGRIVVIGVGGGAGADVNLLTLMAKRGRIHASTLRTRPLEDKARSVQLVEAHVLPFLRDDKPSLQVPVAATYPMSEAEAAYDRFAAGGKLGKIVLTRATSTVHECPSSTPPSCPHGSGCRVGRVVSSTPTA